jgi:hypothetical protein
MFLHSSSGCKVGRLSDCEIPEFDASHRRRDGLEKRCNSANKFKETGLAADCTAGKIPFIYSFSGNCAASVPISIFMYLFYVSDIYIPKIGPHISLQQNRHTDHGNIYINISQIY